MKIDLDTSSRHHHQPTPIQSPTTDDGTPQQQSNCCSDDITSEEREFLNLAQLEYNKNPTYFKMAFQLLTPRHMMLLCVHLDPNSVSTPPITRPNSDSLPFFFAWNTIKYLDLTGNLIRSEGCKHIAQMLSHNESIEVLNLSMNDISASGVKHLCQVLTNKHHHHHHQHYQNQQQSLVSGSPRQSNPNVNNNSSVTNSSGSIISSTNKNFTLKHLDLSMNRLGNEGMEHLSQMLRHNDTLVTLSVRSNKVKSQEGVSHLMEMLAIAHASETLQEVFV